VFDPRLNQTNLRLTPRFTIGQTGLTANTALEYA
jgi:hypothetical protein